MFRRSALKCVLIHLPSTRSPNLNPVNCLLEPIPANAGLFFPGDGYLEFLREITTKHGALLIFDEVMTGFRVAAGGVQEIEAITPDLTTLGKIIGGGLPVGALGGRANIMDQLAPIGPVYQAGTLSGNPLAMAAGIAALELLEAESPYARLDLLGGRIQAALTEAAQTKGLPLQVPQVGSMFSFFFSDSPVRNYDEATDSATEHFKVLFQACLENGVYLPPSPFETCFISTAHDGEAIDRACEVISDAIVGI